MEEEGRVRTPYDVGWYENKAEIIISRLVLVVFTFFYVPEIHLCCHDPVIISVRLGVINWNLNNSYIILKYISCVYSNILGNQRRREVRREITITLINFSNLTTFTESGKLLRIFFMLIILFDGFFASKLQPSTYHRIQTMYPETLCFLLRNFWRGENC